MTPPPISSKGKGKAPAKFHHTVDNVDEGEIVSGSEEQLEFSDLQSIDESDDSGSEFEASEDGSEELSDAEDSVFISATKRKPRLPAFNSMTPAEFETGDVDFGGDDDDDDDVMLEAALQLSRETTLGEGTGASSHKSRTSTNPEALRRAAAAGKRLGGYSSPIDLTMSELSAPPSSDEEPLTKTKVKPKSKGKGKKATVNDTSAPKHMTFAQMKQMRKQARREAAAQRRNNKEEEIALISKLGRLLTHVSLQKL